MKEEEVNEIQLEELPIDEQNVEIQSKIEDDQME